MYSSLFIVKDKKLFLNSYNLQNFTYNALSHKWDKTTVEWWLCSHSMLYIQNEEIIKQMKKKEVLKYENKSIYRRKNK